MSLGELCKFQNLLSYFNGDLGVLKRRRDKQQLAQQKGKMIRDKSSPKKKIRKKGDNTSKVKVKSHVERLTKDEDESYEAEKESSPSFSIGAASDSCSSVEFHWSHRNYSKPEGTSQGIGDDCGGSSSSHLHHHQHHPCPDVTETQLPYTPGKISLKSHSSSYSFKPQKSQIDDRSFVRRLSLQQREEQKEETSKEKEEKSGLGLSSTGFLNDAKNKPITGASTATAVKSKRRARARETRKEAAFSNLTSSSSSDEVASCDNHHHFHQHHASDQKSRLVRYHSDETLDRKASRIDKRTARYYRRRSQEFILKPPFSVLPDPNATSLISKDIESDDDDDDDGVLIETKKNRITAKPPLTAIELQWVQSHLYLPRRTRRRNSEEPRSNLVAPIETDIQSAVSLDNISHNIYHQLQPTHPYQPNVTSFQPDTAQTAEGLVTRSTVVSVDSVDFRCLDDFLPKISSSDPGIYEKNDLVDDVDQVDKVKASHRYDSVLSVATGHSPTEPHSIVSHLSPTNDSGVSSQSVASSPILSQAPSPPLRGCVRKLSSVYGNIKQRAFPGHLDASTSSSCSDLFHRQVANSMSNNSDILSKSYHGEYANEQNNNISCSQLSESVTLSPENEQPKTSSFETKQSVRDIIKNIERNLKTASCSELISSSFSKFHQPEVSPKTICDVDRPQSPIYAKIRPNVERDRQRRSNLTKREQFRKLREPTITKIVLPDRLSHKKYLEDSLLNKPKPRPTVLNMDSWARSRVDKFIATAKFKKIAPKDRKLRKLDEAINELEEIYASLNLDDEDLLDRAERRDMPSKFQLLRFNPKYRDNDDLMPKNYNLGKENHLPLGPPPPIPEKRRVILPPETGWKHPHCEVFCQRRRSLGCVESLLASADPPCNNIRTPPRRRSALPDPIADDLAVRRMIRTPTESLALDETEEDKKIPSYLLLSPIYSPSSSEIKADNELLYPLEPEPDIEKDDLSYRKFTQSDAASVAPPHPPFGIPVGVTNLSTINNYVQASLSEKDKQTVYYRVKPYYPHLVKDDMAFRNFRKDMSKSASESNISNPDLKLLPITTKHLLSQQQNIQQKPNSHNLQLSQSNRVSLIVSGFENRATQV